MNCTETQALLQDLLDGRLRPDQERQVHAHVSSCAVCEQELDLYRQVFDVLAAEPEPTVQLADGIMAKVAAEQSTPQSRLWGTGIATAASVLVVISAWLLWSPEPVMPNSWRAWASTLAAWSSDWQDEAAGAWTGAAEDASEAWASVGDAAAQLPIAEQIAAVTFPQVPMFVVIAACIIALAVDVYYLRKKPLLSPARILAF